MKIVFTDLDGTLLDHRTYSYKEALPALNLLKRKKIPVIFCTSKTRAETEYYRKELGNEHPFIVENGGAIYIPKNYFPFKFEYDKKTRDYYVIILGTERKKLKKVIDLIKGKGIAIKTFGDMSVEELSMDTGLSPEKARLAKKREYDEPFIIGEKDEKKVVKIIKQNNLNYTRGGRYSHIMGKSDKGKAVEILIGLYKRTGKIISIGIGDSKNDFEMLEHVDLPYLVQKVDKSYVSKRFKKAGGVGPAGWNKIILENDRQKKGRENL